MSANVELPDETLGRIEAEAARRGVTVAEVIAEFAERLPAPAQAERSRPSFVGAGASAEGLTHRIDELLSDGFGRDDVADR